MILGGLASETQNKYPTTVIKKISRIIEDIEHAILDSL